MDLEKQDDIRIPLTIKHSIVFVLIAFMFVQLIGCAGITRRQNVRDGFLNRSLVKDAFLDTWGQPDKTRIMSGDEIMKADIGRGGGSFFKGRSSYEIWEYRKYGATLVFDGVQLVNWNVTKEKEELKRLCQEDPACKNQNNDKDKK